MNKTRIFHILTPREAKVLRMRFGIAMDADYTLEEVGKQLDVSRERIRQIEAKAIRKLVGLENTIDDTAHGDDILSRPVIDLGMTTRTTNALRAENIHYVGDLIKLTADDCKKLRGMGRKGLLEITELLAAHGLRLQPGVEAALLSRPRADGLPSAESLVDKFHGKLSARDIPTFFKGLVSSPHNGCWWLAETGDKWFDRFIQLLKSLIA